MIRSHRCRRPLAALLGVLCTQAALAGTVTVNVTAVSGASAEDTVIVFDPLDAAPPASHDEASIDQINKTLRAARQRGAHRHVHHLSQQRPHSASGIFVLAREDIHAQAVCGLAEDRGDLRSSRGWSSWAATFTTIWWPSSAWSTRPISPRLRVRAAPSFNLPAGRYRLRAWHPNVVAAVAPREIVVAAGPMSIPLSIDLDGGPATVAAWPE